MESSAYYPQLDNEEYLKNYDFVLSYKLTSDVVTHYFFGYRQSLRSERFRLQFDHQLGCSLIISYSRKSSFIK